MAKQFIWLRDSCYPRKGPKLEKNKLHNVKDYPVEVVEYWIECEDVKLQDSPAKSKKEEKG